MLSTQMRPGAGGRGQRVRCTVVTLHLYDEMFANYFSFIPRLLPAWMLTYSFLLLGFLLSNTIAPADGAEKITTTEAPRVIVIGFVGVFVRRNDTVHQEVQLAAHLRQQYPAHLEVRMFENRQGRQAHREVLGMLDANRDRELSDREKRTARIVIYGHSWGASEGVTLARKLGQDGIPVLLTIQVDSVSKIGQDDRWIPANVEQAVNFYQANGLLHGRREILAADRSRTEILGNYRVDYKTKHVSCDGFPWYAQMFMSPHIKIECDPSVWNQVESLIRSKLPAD
jgi:pimeloyl-ACP methyl ester carboxylesterase